MSNFIKCDFILNGIIDTIYLRKDKITTLYKSVFYRTKIDDSIEEIFPGSVVGYSNSISYNILKDPEELIKEIDNV